MNDIELQEVLHKKVKNMETGWHKQRTLSKNPIEVKKNGIITRRKSI